MNFKTLSTFLAYCALASSALSQGKNPDRIYQLTELGTATIAYGTKKLKVWIMDTPTKRNEGMMFLTDKEVRPNDAMLFVFPDSDQRSFWMRNTLIPLDIAFLDASGKVLNTARMKPRDETGIPSKGSAMFALEMKSGAFARLGIRAGTKFSIPKDVKAKF